MQLKQILILMVRLIIQTNNYVYSSNIFLNIPNEIDEINPEEEEIIKKFILNPNVVQNDILQHIAQKIFIRSKKISIEYLNFMILLQKPYGKLWFDEILIQIKKINKNKTIDIINNDHNTIKQFILLIGYIIKAQDKDINNIQPYLEEIDKLQCLWHNHHNNSTNNLKIILESKFFQDKINFLKRKKINSKDSLSNFKSNEDDGILYNIIESEEIKKNKVENNEINNKFISYNKQIIGNKNSIKLNYNSLNKFIIIGNIIVISLLIITYTIYDIFFLKEDNIIHKNIFIQNNNNEVQELITINNHTNNINNQVIISKDNNPYITPAA